MGIPESAQRVMNAVAEQGDMLDQALSLLQGKTAGAGEGDIVPLLEGTLEILNSSATKVAGYVFRGAASLKEVNLPNAESLGTYSFYGCSSLASLYAPRVTTLGTYCFYTCRTLTEVDFPMVEAVLGFCFYNCTRLGRADFGALTSVAASGFAGCSALHTLILRNPETVVALHANAFSGTTFTGYVYVPATLVEAYKEDAVWATYADQIRAIEDYPDICWRRD